MTTTTSRSPNGLTNCAPWQTMGNAGIPDPTWAHVYVTDFDTYLASDWGITLVGTGAVTQVSADGGAIQVATTNGATDATMIQQNAAGFKLIPGKACYFKFAGQLSDIGSDVFYAGLIALSATPLAANDGIYLTKVSGSATLSLVAKLGGVATTVALPASEVLAAATNFELGIAIDAKGGIFAYFNPTTGSNPISASASAAGQARGYVARIPATVAGVTQVLLSPSFGLVNASAAVRTMNVDYIVAARER